MKRQVRVLKAKRGWAEKIAWVIGHEFFYSLRWIGMRDRLRCPACRAVGTWKPHKGPRRWLCKFCGAFVDLKRYAAANPCGKKKVWMIYPLKKLKTPRERCGRIDPWRG